MFSYQQEDNTVAICSKFTSIPEGAEWVEVTEIPDAPRASWRIVDGALIFDSTIKTEIDTAVAVAAFKASRETAVSEILVTVDALVFDGDEASQTRMARAVAASEPLDTTLWRLADNSVVTVTREQLRQALRLAGEAQTTLWMG